MKCQWKNITAFLNKNIHLFIFNRDCKKRKRKETGGESDHVKPERTKTEVRNAEVDSHAQQNTAEYRAKLRRKSKLRVRKCACHI